MTESAVGWMRVKRGGVWGPWHKLSRDGGQPQAWCGSKITGFYKGWTDTDETPEGRTCTDCVRALASGRAKAWRKK